MDNFIWDYRCISLYIYVIMLSGNKTDQVLIRMEAALKADLQKLADKDHRALSDYIRLQLIKLVEASKLAK